MSAWRRAGLATRLFAMLAAVSLTGAATAWAVALAVGPGIFHTHLTEAGLGEHDEATMHAEQAFASASVLALAAAVAAAIAASLAASAWLARRASRSLASLSDAATAVGAGDYTASIRADGLGPEFGELARAFEAMRERLGDSTALRERLLADLAHELRTPVTNLDATLEAVADGLLPLDADTLGRLRDQGRRLTRLADDLASVTRAEAGLLELHPVPIDPVELAKRAVAAGAVRAAERGVVLRALPADGLPTVEVDPERLAQVLDNLVANSLAHTAEGDTIMIGCEATADAVKITVADTGAGIAAEHLPHVLERFYRVDSARDRHHGGSGIGLAICKALVEAHGGAIAVSSDGPGHGAVVTVRLPR